MSKNNKKKNPQQIKAEHAHQKNLYLKRIKEMMEILGAKGAFELLSQKELELIYFAHLRPAKFINDGSKEKKLTNQELKMLNENLTYMLKNKFINLGSEQKSVSLYDFFALIETIHYFWRNIDDSYYANAKIFKEKFRIFDNDFKEIRVKVFEMVRESISSLMLMVSNLLYCLLWTEVKIGKSINDGFDKSFLYNNQIVHVERPESQLIELEGRKRSIYRLGVILDDGVQWLTMKPGMLSEKLDLIKSPLKPYIQLHAIERFNERLGAGFKNMTYVLILGSLFSNQIHRPDDGSFLFPVSYMSIKLGYLKATIVDDILLIRTFLFLTNNGTPEGTKLSQLIGLKKEDKKYLKIDKLDIFIHSDIEKNQKLKDIFIEAGCGDLFKMKDHVVNISDRMVHCADYISRYLELEKETSDYEIGII
jgi:hypothetical protein